LNGQDDRTHDRALEPDVLGQARDSREGRRHQGRVGLAEPLTLAGQLG
jgi:hypothetical protein